MTYIKSAEKIKQKGRYWVDSLKKIKEENPDKDIVIVAMSRKMPRLIEVFVEILKILEATNCEFITEHVLPYFLKEFDPTRQIIVIVDDAMYYGSTINMITGYIKQLYKEADVRVLPVVRNERITSLNYAEFGYDIDSKDYNGIITEQDIPFFTTWSAKQFIDLGRPLDMEFPILHININRDSFSRDRLANALKKALEEVFDEEENVIYSVDNKIIRHNSNERKDNDNENNTLELVSNYSVLPKEGTQFDHWNKDFSKLRFFITNRDVQIVAYAPCLLSEDDMTSSKTLFSDNRIQSLWEEVKSCEMASWPEDGEVSYIARNLRYAYEKQCFRSKAVWINYLASLIYLLKQKEVINKLVDHLSDMFVEDAKESAYFDKKDTSQLLPARLIDDITLALNNIYRNGLAENSEIFSIQSEVIADQELIPDDCRDEYIRRTRIGMQRCTTASEALSVLFSQQLLILNKDGEISDDTLRRTQRLQFGITYNAMRDLLSFPIGTDGLWCEIHKWIDKNIDAGCVKPYYERIVHEGIAYWVRMFRTGENEDSFTKIRRICEFIIGKLREKENRGFVKRSHIEDVLTLAWEDPCMIIGHKYKWDYFNKVKDDVGFSLAYRIPDGKEKKIIEFLKKQYYLMNLDDSEGVARLATLDDSPVATPLEQEQEDAISDYVEAYYFYKKTQYQTYVMNNFFPPTDYTEYFKSLTEWRCVFSSYVQKTLSAEIITEVQYEKYESLNDNLNGIIRESILAEIIETDNNENDNRIKIRKHLQEKADNENYKKYKNKINETAAIKELFYQLFIIPNELRRTVKALASLLLYLPDDENKTVIHKYIQMNDEERNLKENKEEFSFTIRNILKNDAT